MTITSTEYVDAAGRRCDDGRVPVPRYPSYGSMGGGSGLESRAQDAWEKQYGPPPGEPGSRVYRDDDGKLWKKTIAGVPEDLGRELWERRSRGKCTYVRKVYHVIRLDERTLVGVAGDGGNAAYEWFVWRDGKLEMSDVGYGDCNVPLRDVLVREL